MEEGDKESIQEIVLEDSKDKETKIGRGDQRAGKLHEKLLRDVRNTTNLSSEERRKKFREILSSQNSSMKASSSQVCYCVCNLWLCNICKLSFQDIQQ